MTHQRQKSCLRRDRNRSEGLSLHISCSTLYFCSHLLSLLNPHTHKDSRVHEGLLHTSLCTCIFSSSFPDGYPVLRSLVKFAVNQIMPLCGNLERRSRRRWKKRRGAETGCSNVRMVAAGHGWMMDYLEVRHEKVC